MKEHPSESVHLLVPFLKDARRFILRHGHTIRENPLQTYGAALVFSPVESIIRHSFWETRNPGFGVIRNLEYHWPTCLKQVGHNSSISSISASHDGQELALAGLDYYTNLPSVWIRNIGTGILLAQFNTDTELLALTWSCDGYYLLAVTKFGKVVRLDRAIETTNPFGISLYATPEGYDDAAICSSGIASVVRVSCANGEYTKSEVFTWKFTQRHQKFRTWESPKSKVSSIALSPDGSLLAVSVKEWLLEHVVEWRRHYHTSTVQVFEVNTGTRIQHLVVAARSLAFSSDGCRLFVHPSDRKPLVLTVVLFPSRTCEDLRLPKDFVADAMAISPDYATIFTTSHSSFTSWDLETLSSVVEAPEQSDPPRLDDGCPIMKIAISPSGRFMITLSKDGESLSLWRLPKATFEKGLTAEDDYKWSFSQPSDISKDKEALILHANERADVWFLEEMKDTHIKPSSSIELPIGDLCLGSISEAWKYRRWGSGARFHHVNVSMTDGRMAAVSFNDTVEVSELGSTANLHFDYKEPGNHTISAIALSPSSTYLAISYNTTIRIWTLADPSTRHELETNDKVKSLVFSPDESSLVYSTGTSIWSCAMSGYPECLLQNGGLTFSSTPCFSSSGQILAWLIRERLPHEIRQFVHLWDTSRGLRLPTFEVSYQAYTISFSKDDQILYALGYSTLENYQLAKEAPQLGSIGGADLTYDKRIAVTSAWISCNGQRLLAIPEKYYIQRLSCSSNYLTLKIENKDFIIFDFN